MLTTFQTLIDAIIKTIPDMATLERRVSRAATEQGKQKNWATKARTG